MSCGSSIGRASQVIEDFWGVELSRNKRELTWEVDENDGIMDPTLELRQACLGASAKEGERNVVELTTDNDEGDSVTHTILSMRVGGTEQTTLFLTLKPPSKFRLVEGNGPVHVVGQLVETIDESLISSDEDSEDEPSMIEEKSTNPRKRPATSTINSAIIPAKHIKTAERDEEEEDEEDSEEEEEFSDEESDDDDDSEDEESDQIEPPKTIKSQANGKLKNGKPTKKAPTATTPKGFKTPQPAKQNAKQQLKKGAQSVPPKSNKDSKKTPAKTPAKNAPDINEIQKKLVKMNVPKKLDKFKNFVANSFKIKDDSVKKQLWEFCQKNHPQK